MITLIKFFAYFFTILAYLFFFVSCLSSDFSIFCIFMSLCFLSLCWAILFAFAIFRCERND